MTNKPLLDRLLLLINDLTDGNKKRFAEMLEVTPSYIDRWTNQGILPSAEQLTNIHDKLNININWLLTGEGSKYIKKEEQVLQVAEELAPYGYSKEEKQYLDRLIKILRTKQDGTVTAIKQNIDAFLTTPDKKKDLVKKTKAG